MLSWLMVVAFAAGCGGQRYYADTEDALETSGYYHLQDHISTYYPSGVALNFPGYIVGFEEADRSLVTADSADVIIDEAVFTSGYTVQRLVKATRYDVPFVSHIMRYEGQPYGEGNCALYNLYHNHGSIIVEPCREVHRDHSPVDDSYETSFVRSWHAMDILEQRLKDDVASGEFTHLVVAIMGLDTAQEEAMRNYKSIVSSIRRNAGDDFRPLFVGLTWPSFYANRWFDPLWEALAYHPIADRADILGLTWLGVLFNDVIAPLGDQIEISVIAHSFGARAATMGICVGSALKRQAGHKEEQPGGGIENFIGLAPAFSLSRFVDGEFLFYENVYYRDYCPNIRRFVFTASGEDKAFRPVFWSDPVGNHKFMTQYCAMHHKIDIACVSTDTDGRIQDYDRAAKISYIDTTAIMRYTMPGVGSAGGGHSDIYRPQIGRFLWNVINGESQ